MVASRTKDSERVALESFVDNWGRLSEAFGMKRDLGRAHALIYISQEPVDDFTLAQLLSLGIDEARAYVDELIDWGVVQAVPVADRRVFETGQDPWSWFLRIVSERHYREFIPVLHAMRKTLAAVHALDMSDPSAKELRLRTDRFTKFVEDLSGLIELFLRLGARPMAAVLKTIARIVPHARG